VVTKYSEKMAEVGSQRLGGIRILELEKDLEKVILAAQRAVEIRVNEPERVETLEITIVGIFFRDKDGAFPVLEGW
jgi:hypothetical protein